MGYFLEVDVEYPKHLFNSHEDLPFLPERKKIKRIEKLICEIEDKEKCVIHIRALKQTLNHGLKLKNVHRVIKFNQDSENKILIVFDDMISDMIPNKKLDSIVTKLFIRGMKLNTSLVFIIQSYFKVPKDVRLNTSHFFIAKIPNKRELKQIAVNHSSDISTKDFINIYRECTAKPYSFLVIDTTLASDNPLRFRKLFLEYNKRHDN